MRRKKPNDLAIINEWLAGFAPKTANGYLGDIAFFCDYVEVPLGAVSTEMIERFIKLAECPSSIVRKRRLAAIRGLYRFAFKKQYLNHDPAESVGGIPPLKERAPVILREAHVLRLLRFARNDREYIIIGLAYYVALTSVEIAALSWKDLKSQTAQITGENARAAHIPDHLWKYIERYRTATRGYDRDPVFLSRSLGNRLSTRQINRIINQTSSAAKIPGELVNVRMLRASHANHAFLRGANVEAVGEIMHTKAKTTVRYRPARHPAEITRTGDLLPRGRK